MDKKFLVVDLGIFLLTELWRKDRPSYVHRLQWPKEKIRSWQFQRVARAREGKSECERVWVQKIQTNSAPIDRIWVSPPLNLSS